jgi:hypothetical protein
LEPPPSPPDEAPAEEVLPANGEEADDDPADVTRSAAVVPVVEVAGPLRRRGKPRGCSVAPSESRTMCRGVTGRKAGFTRSVVEARAKAEGTRGAVSADAGAFPVARFVEPICSV